MKNYQGKTFVFLSLKSSRYWSIIIDFDKGNTHHRGFSSTAFNRHDIFVSFLFVTAVCIVVALTSQQDIFYVM